MVQNDTEQRRVLFSTVKRNVLVGKLCLFCIILAVVHVILDASQGLYESAAVDCVFGLIIVFAYLLNQWGYHRTSKVFVLLTLNILFAFFVSVLPRDVGIYLYYFPLIVSSSALFESSEKLLRYFFNALPLIFLTLLVMNDFDLLPSMEFDSPLYVNAFFAINAFSTAAVTIICVNFMQKLNVSSERELKQLAEEVHGKNINLEKTNAELDRFLYSTSHDLRSPLSSIKGLVNIARMETADEKLQRYFSMMIDRVDKLDFFIKDIIDYSKNARTEIRNEPVDFNSLLTEVTDNLRYIEGAETIDFQSKVLISDAVHLDKTRLSVVLNNLLANAIKYHDPKKDKQWIDVQVSNSGGGIKLQVSDNGMGIDPEHHSRIFDMFYRGTFHSKGSGLGLYIVKETVAKMKGTIGVESVPGKGSSFSISLPAS
jgi:signal transduction histidine kinase